MPSLVFCHFSTLAFRLSLPSLRRAKLFRLNVRRVLNFLMFKAATRLLFLLLVFDEVLFRFKAVRAEVEPLPSFLVFFSRVGTASLQGLLRTSALMTGSSFVTPPTFPFFSCPNGMPLLTFLRGSVPLVLSRPSIHGLPPLPRLWGRKNQPSSRALNPVSPRH